MASDGKRGLLRSIWDFFVLLTGISTASNLERTQGRKLRSAGVFLVRKPAAEDPDSTAAEQ